MRYYHKLGDEVIVQSDSTSFHLSRKAGGFISFGLPNCTRYQGLCTILPWNNTWELVKTIESIHIDDTAEAIVLLPDSVERIYKNAFERFTVLQGATTYDLTQYNGKVVITLDMRFIHDFDEWGRAYTLQNVPGGHVITYHCPKYSFCLAILGAEATFKEEWREVTYAYDEYRHSKATFYVCDALTYNCTHSLHLRFGVGWTPAEAVAQANNTNPQHHILSHPARDAALQAAVNDIDGLITTLPHLDLGILAGYPWFYQVYTRDEAISVGALIRLGNITEAKQILFRELQHILPDGRISNRFPGSEIGSADGVGWAFQRLWELQSMNVLSVDEQRYVHTQLGESIERLHKHYTKNGLIFNNWKETWMDTTGGYEDGREGARIEIQAMMLRMYSLMSVLCKNLKDGDSEYYAEKAAIMKNTVRETFYDPQTHNLADGVADHIDRTVRPNIFLAHYIFPDLFSNEEWQLIFRHTLQKLWLPWGGLSTIDKEHLLFTPQHTGETDKSYHRGDSWYFINNIAAIGLAQRGFTSEAEHIYKASKEQLLSIGYPGHAAETSSAKAKEAAGCFSQAWSAATFVELWFEHSSWHHHQS